MSFEMYTIATGHYYWPLSTSSVSRDALSNPSSTIADVNVLLTCTTPTSMIKPMMAKDIRDSCLPNVSILF